MLSYVSGSTGEEINLTENHIKAHIKTAGFYDYEYDIEEIETVNSVEVERFYLKSKQYDLILDFRGNREERAEAAEKLFTIANRDVVYKKIGKLYFKDQYLNCYIVGSQYENAERARIVRKTMGVYAPKPIWITEASRSFLKIRGSGGTEEYLDYEYDYEYDYSTPTDGSEIWEVDHFAPCEFLMTIFGPVSNPRILINGYPYEVYTELGSNDYLQIDSRNNKVIKYLSNGTRQDMYNYRAKQQSIFEPITPGNITVMWPGTYGFDLTLFCERSEPKWKMKSS